MSIVNGSIDTNFGTNGIIFSNKANYSSTNSLAIQTISNTKYIVAVGRAEGYVSRYTINGTLDTSFGTNGYTATGIGGATCVLSAVVILPDNSIIVGGQAVDSGLQAGYITKLNSNGIVDTTFGTVGTKEINFTDLGVAFENIEKLSYQTIGGVTKIIGIGSLYYGGPIHGVILRLNMNGTYDTTFGDGAPVTIDNFGSFTPVPGTVIVRLSPLTSGVVLNDNSILVTGSSNSNIFLSKYTQNGILDITFGTSGIVETDSGIGGDNGISIGIQTINSVQKILVGFNNGTGIGIARYSLAGVLDTTFRYSSSNVLTETLNNTYPYAESMVIHKYGKITMVGRNQSNTDVMLSCFNADGTLDTTFGTNGYIYDLNSPNFISIYDVVINNVNGYEYLIVAGEQSSSGNGFLARYSTTILAPLQATGSFTISNKTYLVNTTFTNPTIDNTNVVGGFNWSSSDSSIVSYSNNVATINGIGTVTLIATPVDTTNYLGTITGTLTVVAPPNFSDYLDSSFGSSGTYNLDIQISGVSYNNFTTSIKKQETNKLIVAGYSSPVINSTGSDKVLTIVRYNINTNTLDNSFGTNGIFTLSSTQFKHIGNIHILSDKKILVVGQTSTSNACIIKINKDGSLDTSFH